MTMLTDLGIYVDEAQGGNQKIPCPKCSSSRKNKTDPCLSVNLDEGVFKCHHCDFKGSIKNSFHLNCFNHVSTSLSARHCTSHKLEK